MVDTPHYGDTQKTRNDAGYPSPAERSNDAIDAIITAKSKIVNSLTGRENDGTEDWQPSETLFPLVAEATEYFAAAEIRRTWKDAGDKAKEYNDLAMKDIVMINKANRKQTGRNTNLYAANTSYKTRGLNPNVLPYMSQY